MTDHKKEVNLLVPEADGSRQGNGFEEDAIEEYLFIKEMFPGFDKDWDECDPKTAPLLTSTIYRSERQQPNLQQSITFGSLNSQRIASSTNNIDLTSTQVKNTHNDDSLARRLASINRTVMPFHHLIPAALLTLPSDLSPAQGIVDQLQASHPQRAQMFWLILAAQGISATEAALLKDSITCSFLEFDGQRLVKIDWENLHFDELEGCSEIYLAEMFLCKRPIYEAGNELRVALEITSDDLTRHLPEAIFKSLLDETADILFFNSLTSSYALTISTSADNRIGNNQAKNQVSQKNGKNEKKPEKRRTHKTTTFTDYFTSHITEGARRVETWMSKKNSTASGDRKTIYRLRLADYWLDWQKAARAATFDFAFLQTVNDAMVVRFYELTKLWRVPFDHQPGGEIPSKMEIEYGDFCSLMPIPRMDTERAIKWQINELVKPLKGSGYLKSFAVKADWRDTGSQNAKLIFKFAQ